MELSIQAISLIKYVLEHDCKKTVDQKTGAEVDSLRCLNGEESAQRRFFNIIAEKILNEYGEESKKVRQEFNDWMDSVKTKAEENNPKKEGEKDGEYNGRITAELVRDAKYIEKLKETKKLIDDLTSQKHKIEITEKTSDVIKKYIDLWGEEVGFKPGDDAIVEEINGEFK